MDDFMAFHKSECDYGPCYCTYWWTEPQVWDDVSEVEKVQKRNQLLDEGVFDGFLLYEEDTPVAWCQCARRDDFPFISMRFDLKPEKDVWALTCFLVKKEMRNLGIMEMLLDLVLDELEKQGASGVEGYPRRLTSFDEMYAWNGPEQAYVKKGFQFVKYVDGRCVYRYDFLRKKDDSVSYCLKK
jgi:GNAT superfamily N-acetyltransferase